MFSHLRLVACVLLVFATRLSADEPDQIPKEVVLHEFPFNNISLHVKLPGEVGGRRLPFIVDTGSTLAFFDESLKPLLGSPLREETAYFSTKLKKVEVFQAPQATWGPITLNRDTEVAVHDFSRANRVCREDILGVIGMSDLKTMRVQFDFDAAKLRILSQLGPDLGSSIRLRILGSPYVECSVGRIPGAVLLIDTGAGSIRLQPKIFDTLRFHGRIRSVGRIPEANTFGELTFVTAGRLCDFSIGDLEFKNLLVKRSEDNRIGLIGLRFLSRFVTTFDFPNSVMYLKKGARFNEPDVEGIQGFGVFFIGDALKVVGIDDNGPADQVGLKVNDVIEQIDGQDFNGKSLYQVNRSFEKPGQDLKLRIRREHDEPQIITIAIPKPPANFEDN